MKIGFYKLWKDRPLLTSYVNVREDVIVWGFNSKRIKDFLSTYEHPAVGGQFDLNNPEHIRALPKILHGTYLFAAEIVPESIGA